MYAVMDRLDQLPRPALIALVVIGFIVFWPVGLALLVYLIWSGRMFCGRYGRTAVGTIPKSATPRAPNGGPGARTGARGSAAIAGARHRRRATSLSTNTAKRRC